MAALAPYVEAALEAARRSGRREPRQACAADALVAMARTSCERRSDGASSPPRPPAMVHVRIDHAAFVRGHTEAGETCEVPGIGPIPVATARALSSDAIVSAIVGDGVDVRAVAHLGRTIPAHVRTALEARDLTCVVPGCMVDERLEIDHIVPLAEGAPTRLDNLARLCEWHHYPQDPPRLPPRGRPRSLELGPSRGAFATGRRSCVRA